MANSDLENLEIESLDSFDLSDLMEDTSAAQKEFLAIKTKLLHHLVNVSNVLQKKSSKAEIQELVKQNIQMTSELLNWSIEPTASEVEESNEIPMENETPEKPKEDHQSTWLNAGVVSNMAKETTMNDSVESKLQSGLTRENPRKLIWKRLKSPIGDQFIEKRDDKVEQNPKSDESELDPSDKLILDGFRNQRILNNSQVQHTGKRLIWKKLSDQHTENQFTWNNSQGQHAEKRDELVDQLDQKTVAVQIDTSLKKISLTDELVETKSIFLRGLTFTVRPYLLPYRGMPDYCLVGLKIVCHQLPSNKSCKTTIEVALRNLKDQDDRIRNFTKVFGCKPNHSLLMHELIRNKELEDKYLSGRMDCLVRNGGNLRLDVTIRADELVEIEPLAI